MQFKTCEEKVLADLDTAENKVSELTVELEHSKAEYASVKKELDLLKKILFENLKGEASYLTFGYIWSEDDNYNNLLPYVNPANLAPKTEEK